MADWWDIFKGGAQGAATGAAAGSVVPGWGNIIGGTLGAIGGAYAASGNAETSTQRKQKELVDDLLASLKGNGSYNDLFKADEGAFQKSFVDPAKARFKNQTAPQIRENYAQYGQQNGTGINDELLRAGVDMDSMLNQHYAQFQNNAQNRQVGAMNSILGAGAGAPEQPSFGQTALQAGSAYLGSKTGQEDIQGIIDYYNPKGKPKANGFTEQ